MNQQHVDYQVVPYPKIRRWMAAMFRSVQHKPMIHGLLEVDVTRARAHLDEHKAVQAIRFGSKHLILFEDVDVYLPIEHDMAGQKQVIPYVIRAANRKTVREIHHEIRTAQVQDVTKDLTRVQSLPTLLFQP